MKTCSFRMYEYVDKRNKKKKMEKIADVII